MNVYNSNMMIVCRNRQSGCLKSIPFFVILYGLMMMASVPPAIGQEYKLRITTPKVEPGNLIIVECISPANHNKNAWIGFYSKDANDKDSRGYTFLLNLTANKYDAEVPADPGSYNFRVFADENYTPAAVSETIEVKEGGLATVVPGTGTPATSSLAQSNPAAPLVPVAATPAAVSDTGKAESIKISKVSSTPVFLDASSNQVTISFTVDQPCEATVAIHELNCVPQYMGGINVSLSSNIVKRIKQKCAPGSNFVVWDGSNESGVVQSNIYYTYHIDAVAGGVSAAWNARAYQSGPVAYTNFLIDSNYCFQANRPMKISYDLQAPAFVMIAVPQEPYPVIWGEPRDKGANIEYFKGRNSINGTLRYGPMSFSILTQVLPENIVVLHAQTQGIIKALEAESFLIIPTYAQLSEIQYTLDQPASVEVQMKDPNGNMITLLAGQSETVGPHVLEWAGMNNSNRIVHIDGDYEVIVKAEQGSKGLVDKKTANISVRR